jgi:hypothetical protein
MDQNTLKAFGDIVWGALFFYLGIVAVACLFLLLRYRAFRPFRFWGGREVEENAPWRERIRNALLVWRAPRK